MNESIPIFDNASIRNQLLEQELPAHVECASGDAAYEIGRSYREKMLGGVRTDNAPQYQFTPHDSLTNSRALDLRGTAAYPQNLYMRGLGGNDHQYLIAAHQVVRDYTAEGVETVLSPDGVAYLSIDASFHEDTVEVATEKAYRDLFHELERLGMHPLRIWNYMPDINAGADEQGNGTSERYKQFNAGRYAAWKACDPDFSEVCAATGIGNAKPYNAVDITCLATKYPVVHLDNPNQVPFLKYDTERFGVQPCSRRGTVHCTPEGLEVYISGTASITGQENRFAGDNEPKDVRLQTQQTLENIQALISQENLATYLGDQYQIPKYSLSDLQAVRVYIRNEEDLPVIQEELEAAGISQDQIMYLQGDICRRPLDVEIEGLVRETK
jgi:chorismate lyase/3-hydroxybenzoate synthase